MTPEAYDLADALFALAPRNWMNEDNLIAIPASIAVAAPAA